MPPGRRTTAVLVLAATGALLGGCGEGDATQAEPTPVVIPGSTVTIGTEATAPAPTTTAPPTETPTETRTEIPTDTTVTSADDLLARVGGAMGGFETVHLSVGSDLPPPTVEADHQYLGGDDYVAVLTGPAASVEARRVGGTTFVATGDDGSFVEVDPGTAGDDATVVDDLAQWDVLGDLRAVLTGARGFAAGGPSTIGGDPVESYTFVVDAAALVAGAQVPDDVSGTVEVTFSIDPAGLPVRVDQAFVDSDLVVRTDYSDWGVPVTVEAPRR